MMSLQGMGSSALQGKMTLPAPVSFQRSLSRPALLVQIVILRGNYCGFSHLLSGHEEHTKHHDAQFQIIGFQGGESELLHLWLPDW